MYINFTLTHEVNARAILARRASIHHFTLVARRGVELQTFTKRTITQGRQERTHRVVHRCLGLTLDHCRWADRARAGRRWGALGRSRTDDLGAAGARARGAIALRLVALGAVQNDRLRAGNGRLQNIVAQIRNRGHLGLQDILI